MNLLSNIEIWTGFPESFFFFSIFLFTVVLHLASITQPAQPGQPRRKQSGKAFPNQTFTVGIVLSHQRNSPRQTHYDILVFRAQGDKPRNSIPCKTPRSTASCYDILRTHDATPPHLDIFCVWKAQAIFVVSIVSDRWVAKPARPASAASQPSQQAARAASQRSQSSQPSSPASPRSL